MSFDPASFIAGAASNAVGNLLSDGTKQGASFLRQAVAPFLQRVRDQALPQAHVRMEANADALVAGIAAEVTADATSPGEAEARLSTVAAKFEDPDVAVAFADALRAGARSSEPEVHATIAKVVAARLSADSATTHAVTANLAIRVMDSLGPAHLRALALFALVAYVARPNPASSAHPVLPERPATRGQEGGIVTDQAAYDASQQEYVAWVRTLQALASSYAGHLCARIQALAERIGVPEDALPATVTTHLVAAAALVRHQGEPELATALARWLAPPPPHRQSMADAAPRSAVEQTCYLTFSNAARTGGTIRQLDRLWATTLREFTPTPVGLLLGLAALDAMTDERITEEWRWSGTAEHALRWTTYTQPVQLPPSLAGDPKFQRIVGEALIGWVNRGGRLPDGWRR